MIMAFLQYLQYLQLFLLVILFETVISRECLELETGDVSGFNTEKFAGRHQLVMGVMDGPIEDLNLNCNWLSINQHPHPQGGVNVAITFEAADGSILDTSLPHFNSSTDIYAIQLDSYDRLFKQWIDIYFKILLSTDDIVVLTSCVNNEDKKADTSYFISVMRREGSKLLTSEIRDLLPEYIRNNPKMIDLCDN